MRIVVDHLTRMSGERICVAGLEIDTGKHIRPVTAGGVNRRLLLRHGGPFDVGRIVDLGPVTPVPHPPEFEDFRFDPAKARDGGPMPWSDFWDLLKTVSAPTLPDIFGPALERRGHTFATEAGKGKASLGCLRVPSHLVPHLAFPFGRLRISLPAEDADVAVTDLRCFERDGRSIRNKVVDQLNTGMRPGREVLLAVGLANKFAVPGDTVERHWLQVNNIYAAGLQLTEADCSDEPNLLS
jgi:hypothetical protein